MRKHWSQLSTEKKLSVIIMPFVIAFLTFALPLAAGWFKNDGPDLVIEATVPEDGWRFDHKRNGKPVKKRNRGLRSRS